LGRTSLRPGSVILHFSGSGAVHYDLRFSETPITAKNFDAAAPVPRWMLDPLAPHPSPLATSNSLQEQVNAVVEQLQPGKLYYFAARAMGATGQLGPVSPCWSNHLGRRRALACIAGNLRQYLRPAEPGWTVKVWSYPNCTKSIPKLARCSRRALSGQEASR
jgi:hypothetical protein